MAYTAPTASDLKTRFPKFAAVDDTVINSALTEAARQVDQTWLEADYALAMMLLACHIMVMDGHGADTQAQLSSLSGFSRIKSGDLEVSRGDGAGGSSSGGDTTQATTYGQRFAEIRRRNFPPISIV